jgi:Ca2+-binding RTX toxin-like protein
VDWIDGDDNYVSEWDGVAGSASDWNRPLTWTGFIPTSGISPYTVQEYARGIGGADILYGGGGNDVLSGLEGDDVLYGEEHDNCFMEGIAPEKRPTGSSRAPHNII